MGVVRLLDTHVEEHTLPLGVIEVVLDCIPLIQILKFPIDGLSDKWTDKEQPLFSYLDLGYAFNGVETESYQSVLAAAIIFMNAYWLFHLVIFATGFEWGRVSSNARKLFFLITKNLLFLPLLNLIVGYLPLHSDWAPATNAPSAPAPETFPLPTLALPYSPSPSSQCSWVGKHSSRSTLCLCVRSSGDCGGRLTCRPSSSST